MNEIESVKAAAAGDRDAFCSLYDLYKARLYRYALYRLGNQEDAEDAVSSCILSAWEQIGKLKKPDAFPAWMFRILKGSCMALVKDQIAHKEDLSDDVLDMGYTDGSGKRVMPLYGASSGAASVGQSSADPETYVVLKEALNTLPEESREMILLSAVGGLTSKDIGEIFGMPQGTVRSRLSRSMAAMRAVLEAGNEQ